MTTKPRKLRDTTVANVDREAPAYRIIYGQFGGLTPFIRATGVKKSTAHEWVIKGLIPSRRQADILAAAAAAKVKLDPAMFVPRATVPDSAVA